MQHRDIIQFQSEKLPAFQVRRHPNKLLHHCEVEFGFRSDASSSAADGLFCIVSRFLSSQSSAWLFFAFSFWKCPQSQCTSVGAKYLSHFLFPLRPPPIFWVCPYGELKECQSTWISYIRSNWSSNFDLRCHPASLVSSMTSTWSYSAVVTFFFFFCYGCTELRLCYSNVSNRQLFSLLYLF